jgi:hypothetical protein
LTVQEAGTTDRVSGKRDADEVLLNIRPTKRVVGLGMADLRSEGSAAVQRAALARTGPTFESAGGQPSFAAEVMMCRQPY